MIRRCKPNCHHEPQPTLEIQIDELEKTEYPQPEDYSENVRVQILCPKVDIEKIDEVTTIRIEEERRPYLPIVKVNHPSLRKRAAPSLDAEVLGYITDEGKYTLLRIIDDWGQLEDESWIMLEYTIRIQ